MTVDMRVCYDHNDCAVITGAGELESFSIELVEASPFIEQVYRLGRRYLTIGRKPHDRVVYRIDVVERTGFSIEPTALLKGERIA